MRFLLDAQLPRRLAGLLQALGHDALHTLDLPSKNRTSDDTLRQLALTEQRVLVTKDADFVDSFLLRGVPSKLLFVTTGNVSNDDLLAIFRAHHRAVALALTSHPFVEIDRNGLAIHT